MYMHVRIRAEMDSGITIQILYFMDSDIITLVVVYYVTKFTAKCSANAIP